MNELNQTNAGFKTTGKDIMALNTLLSTLNNPNLTGAVVPEGVETKVSTRLTTDKIEDAKTKALEEEMKSHEPPTPERDFSRLFFTGKLMSGKDFCAEQVGAKIFGFADPLYKIQQFFFPGTTKATPGARTFLQLIGQWGRGAVNEKYPITPSRALMSAAIRNLGKDGEFGDLDVDWDTFGTNNDIWLDSLVERVAKNPGAISGVVNVRFENEFKRLTSEGWTHFHVLCSPATWAKRLASAGLNTNSPEVKDLSESLARALDADVTKRLSKGGGKKLRAVWCDENVPCPSPRLYTVEEFVAVVTSVAKKEKEQEPEVDLGDVSLED